MESILTFAILRDFCNSMMKKKTIENFIHCTFFQTHEYIIETLKLDQIFLMQTFSY